MTIVDESTAVTASSLGILVTPNTTADTKGSGDWVELIASTSEETYWVTLQFSSAQKASYLIDFGTGAAASEVVKVADMLFYPLSAGGETVTFPLTIPSGTRVAARCQCASGSASGIYMMCWLSNDDSYGTSTTNQTWGADSTGNTRGATIDPGAVDNTKPTTYTELVSAVGNTVAANYLLVMTATNENGTINTTYRSLIDVATGAASSETDELKNIQYSVSNSEPQNTNKAFWHSIPSGTRVAARCQGNPSVDTADRVRDIVVIGFDVTAPAGGGGMASGDTLFTLTPQAGEPPTTNFATLDTTAEGTLVLDFDDATDEAIYFRGQMPGQYDGTTGMDVTLGWKFSTYVGSQTCDWEVSWYRIQDDTDTAESFSFTPQTVLATEASATGELDYAVIPFTNAQADGIQPNEHFVIKVARDASGGTASPGDAELHFILVDLQ